MIDAYNPKYLRDQTLIINKLIQRGHDVKVLTSMFNDDGALYRNEKLGKLTKKQAKIFRAPGVHIHIPGFKALNTYVPSKAVIKDQYDVIHSYTLFTFSSTISPLIKILTKSSKLVMRTELGPENFGISWPNVTFARVKRNYVYKKYLNLLDKYVNAFYTFSVHELRALCKLNVKEGKIWVIPIPVELNLFSKISEPRLSPYITIGYIGRFLPEKGVHRLIKPIESILKKNQDIRVIFAGPKSNLQYAENIIKRLCMNENFKYFNFLPNIDFFSRVDIVLIPSFYETGAKIVLEGMAAGRLVIARDAYIMNAYIDHGTTGLLFRDELELDKLLTMVIKNSDIVRKVGKNAKEGVKKHDINNIIKLIEKLYKS